MQPCLKNLLKGKQCSFVDLLRVCPSAVATKTRSFTGRRIHVGAALACIHVYLLLSGAIHSQGMEGLHHNYNSIAGSIESKEQKESVYTLYQLMNLRKTIRPRYIHLLDQKQYARSGKILRKGILFTYGDHRVRNAQLSGDFNGWSAFPMQRNRMGVFFYVLPLREIEAGKHVNVYRYKFIADGSWTHDPHNEHKTEDGMGGYLSVFYLDKLKPNRQASVRILKERKRSNLYLVEFAIYLPKAKNVALVGSFNNWNLDHDLMPLDDDGIFRLRLKLKPGNYVYKYVVDGKWILDRYNQATRFDTSIRELCSFLKVPL